VGGGVGGVVLGLRACDGYEGLATRNEP
jgi:hypothetical protein